MFFKSLLYFSSLLAIVSAQSDNALEIAAIKAHFANAGLVPDLLAAFNPSALLNVSFEGVGVISPGQLLQQTRTNSLFLAMLLLAVTSVSPLFFLLRDPTYAGRRGCSCEFIGPAWIYVYSCTC